MRTSKDEVIGGRVWNGYDYRLQVWVRDGVIRPCNHPESMKATGCCAAAKLAGQMISDVAGAEVR